MTEGQELKLSELKPEQHFTQPPPRYTEASIVKAMEEEMALVVRVLMLQQLLRLLLEVMLLGKKRRCFRQNLDI